MILIATLKYCASPDNSLQDITRTRGRMLDVHAEFFIYKIKVYFKMLKKDNNKTGQIKILNITVL